MDISNQFVNLLKIAIVGKPNVGKSTLINQIFHQELSIVNKKPQTTRNKLSFLFKYNDNSYFEFYDTPGYHLSKFKLDDYLNKFVLNAIKEVDLILLMIDVSRPIDDEDIEIISKIYQREIFLIFNKIDLNNDYKVHLDKISQYLKPKKIFFISALKNDTKQLLTELNDYNLKLNHQVIKDLLVENNNDKFIVAEYIRNECLNLLKNEIPYGVAIHIETFNYDKEKNLLTINAVIIVEKESHKSIVIGHKGQMIKQIGINSRQKLLSLYDCKIMLNLFVKIDKDWRNNLMKIKEYGYFN